MNFGDCPYGDCDGLISIGVPERTPVFCKETCETCGREFWWMVSRIQPKAYTLEEFAERFVVDEETKSIKSREEPEPESEVERYIREQVRESMKDAIAKAESQWLNELLYGDGVSDEPKGGIQQG